MNQALYAHMNNKRKKIKKEKKKEKKTYLYFANHMPEINICERYI
jgi:hypothetical protein